MGEADESTNNPTIITPTANNHKLSSTETLQNFNWKGLGCFCCCQKIDHWIAEWNQSSKRSNESSTTPGGTTIVGDRSPRHQPRRSTRSQPELTPAISQPCAGMSRDTNNNNKEKRRTDSWQKHSNSVTKYGNGVGRQTHRPSRQLIKKASKQMKREHKATVTLAVVLGVFLVCWVPFFTLHLTNAICMLMEGENCVHFLPMFLSTWLGYLNSSMNPLVYTLFDIRFRKAFRNIIYCQK